MTSKLKGLFFFPFKLTVNSRIGYFILKSEHISYFKTHNDSYKMCNITYRSSNNFLRSSITKLKFKV